MIGIIVSGGYSLMQDSGSLEATAAGGDLDPGSVPGDTGEPVWTHLDVNDAAAFGGYDLYWLGEEFEGLELRNEFLIHSVTREYTDETHVFPEQNYVSFLYGHCDTSQHGGCAVPLEIQVWPSCLRNPSMYSLGGQPMEYEAKTVRGVPTAAYEDGDRLEVYVGDLAIVIWGDSPERAQRAAEQLYPVTKESQRAGESLADPVTGALDGEGRCPSGLGGGAGTL